MPEPAPRPAFVRSTVVLVGIVALVVDMMLTEKLDSRVPALWRAFLVLIVSVSYRLRGEESRTGQSRSRPTSDGLAIPLENLNATFDGADVRFVEFEDGHGTLP